MSSSDSRAAARMPAGPPASSSERGERLAPVRERGAHQGGQLVGRRGRGAPHPHERGVDVRHGAEHVARDRAHELDLAGELDQHGGDAVRLRARLRGEPVRDLALHHHAPERRLGQLLDRLQDRGRGDAVGEVRDDLVRQRVEAAEPRAHHVADHEVVSASWPASASRSTGSSFLSVSTTCRWRTRRAR